MKQSDALVDLIGGVREPEISLGREYEILSGLGRLPENFEILERIVIREMIGNKNK